MKANKISYDRLRQLKTIENDILADMKTRQQKPANAFRFSIDADNNDQDIEELSDLLYICRKFIVKWQSVFEIED